MIILCPYTRLHPRTVAALDAFAPEAEYADTSGDDYALSDAIRSRWGQDDLVVIEHDIEITETVIPAFRSCPEPWCVNGYMLCQHDGGRRWVYGTHSTGCVRWRRELMRRVAVPRHPWFGNDGAVSFCLSQAGYSPHDHGPVAHLREGAPPVTRVAPLRVARRPDLDGLRGDALREALGPWPP